MGMRKAFWGNERDLKNELHIPEEYVTEADKVSRLFANPRLPIIDNIPTVTMRYRDELRIRYLIFILQLICCAMSRQIQGL